MKLFNAPELKNDPVNHGLQRTILNIDHYVGADIRENRKISDDITLFDNSGRSITIAYDESIWNYCLEHFKIKIDYTISESVNQIESKCGMTKLVNHIHCILDDKAVISFLINDTYGYIELPYGTLKYIGIQFKDYDAHIEYEKCMDIVPENQETNQDTKPSIISMPCHTGDRVWFLGRSNMIIHGKVIGFTETHIIAVTSESAYNQSADYLPLKEWGISIAKEETEEDSISASAIFSKLEYGSINSNYSEDHNFYTKNLYYNM